MSSKPSPFAPDKFPHLAVIDGIEMVTAQSGQRYQGRDDLWVTRCAPGTQIAGIFTKNKAPGAPIEWSRSALHSKTREPAPRVIVVNAGNANVFTGAKGPAACAQTARAAAAQFGGAPSQVLLASTGIIGQVLDATKLTACFPDMEARMGQADRKANKKTDRKADWEADWEAAARAIMTTDTYPKGAMRQTQIGGAPVTLCGIAKGSGMIAPDMATMLGFIFTNAVISQSVLQELLAEYSKLTFNAITVDSDMSTSDMVLLAASGKADHAPIIDVTDPALKDFKTALFSLMQNLAKQVVKDGEGISKFITVKVTGAVSDESAKAVAMSIANSPLVKTAIAGEDANWGRIVMATGKSGEPVDRDKLTVMLGPHLLASKGNLSPNYSEADGATYMAEDNIEITVNLGQKNGQFTVWGCDLTHDYISINADYRS